MDSLDPLDSVSSGAAAGVADYDSRTGSADAASGSTDHTPWTQALADAGVTNTAAKQGDDDTTPPATDGGGNNGPGPVASVFRNLFGHVDPDQWAANGAAIGGVGGGIIGGVIGGTGGGIGGAAGGTLVAPGVGTIGGGIAGTAAGAAEGAVVGGAAGATVLGAAGKLLGGFVNYMEGSDGGSGPTEKPQKPKPEASKPYQSDPGQLQGRPAGEVEQELDKTLVQEGHWTKSPTKDGNGVRYLDGKGGSVIINKGYPQGLEGGGGDAVHQGPYVKIQPGGIRVPLEGNSALGGS